MPIFNEIVLKLGFTFVFMGPSLSSSSSPFQKALSSTLEGLLEKGRDINNSIMARRHLHVLPAYHTTTPLLACLT
jgi:hypothetical protein